MLPRKDDSKQNREPDISAPTDRLAPSPVTPVLLRSANEKSKKRVSAAHSERPKGKYGAIRGILKNQPADTKHIQNIKENIGSTLPTNNNELGPGKIINNYFCVGGNELKGIETKYKLVKIDKNLIRIFNSHINYEPIRKALFTPESSPDEAEVNEADRFAAWLHLAKPADKKKFIEKVKKDENIEQWMVKQYYDDTATPSYERLGSANSVRSQPGIIQDVVQVGYYAYKRFTADPSKENVNAIRECVATSIARKNGMPAQHQELLEAEYSSGLPQFVTLTLLEKKLESLGAANCLMGSEQHTKLLAEVDRSDAGEDACRAKLNTKKKINDFYVPNMSVRNLGINAALVIVQNDEDGVGSVGQNKAILQGEIFGIDFGQSYRTVSPYLATLSEDFTLPVNYKIKNASLYFDSKLSERMAGVLGLYLVSSEADRHEVIRDYLQQKNIVISNEKINAVKRAIENTIEDYRKNVPGAAERFDRIEAGAEEKIFDFFINQYLAEICKKYEKSQKDYRFRAQNIEEEAALILLQREQDEKASNKNTIRKINAYYNEKKEYERLCKEFCVATESSKKDHDSKQANNKFEVKKTEALKKIVMLKQNIKETCIAPLAAKSMAYQSLKNGLETDHKNTIQKQGLKIKELKRYIEKVKKVQRDSLESRKNLLKIFISRMQHSSAIVDLLDNLEKLVSPTTGLSDDKKLIRRNLQVIDSRKNRVPWKVVSEISDQYKLAMYFTSQADAEAKAQILLDYLGIFDSEKSINPPKMVSVDHKWAVSIECGGQILCDIFQERHIKQYKSKVDPESHPPEIYLLDKDTLDILYGLEALTSKTTTRSIDRQTILESLRLDDESPQRWKIKSNPKDTVTIFTLAQNAEHREKIKSTIIRYFGPDNLVKEEKESNEIRLILSFAGKKTFASKLEKNLLKAYKIAVDPQSHPYKQLDPAIENLQLLTSRTLELDSKNPASKNMQLMPNSQVTWKKTYKFSERQDDSKICFTDKMDPDVILTACFADEKTANSVSDNIKKFVKLNAQQGELNLPAPQVKNSGHVWQVQLECTESVLRKEWNALINRDKVLLFKKHMNPQENLGELFNTPLLPRTRAASFSESISTSNRTPQDPSTHLTPQEIEKNLAQMALNKHNDQIAVALASGASKMKLYHYLNGTRDANAQRKHYNDAITAFGSLADTLANLQTAREAKQLHTALQQINYEDLTGREKTLVTEYALRAMGMIAPTRNLHIANNNSRFLAIGTEFATRSTNENLKRAAYCGLALLGATIILLSVVSLVASFGTTAPLAAVLGWLGMKATIATVAVHSVAGITGLFASGAIGIGVAAGGAHAAVKKTGPKLNCLNSSGLSFFRKPQKQQKAPTVTKARVKSRPSSA